MTGIFKPGVWLPASRSKNHVWKSLKKLLETNLAFKIDWVFLVVKASVNSS